MITAAVRAAVGDEVVDLEQKPLNGHWAEIILHADKSGILDGVEIAGDKKPFVHETDLWFKVGEEVKEFQSARDAIGTLVMKFDTAEELKNAIVNQREWLKVVVK